MKRNRRKRIKTKIIIIIQKLANDLVESLCMGQMWGARWRSKCIIFCEKERGEKERGREGSLSVGAVRRDVERGRGRRG